jgi:hypothetical protein
MEFFQALKGFIFLSAAKLEEVPRVGSPLKLFAVWIYPERKISKGQGLAHVQ